MKSSSDESSMTSYPIAKRKLRQINAGITLGMTMRVMEQHLGQGPIVEELI